jgi:uncharacterized protein YjbI with pentapeptide repeats
MKLHEVVENLDVTKCNLSGSTFNDVNLSDITLEKVNLSGGRIEDANLSGLRIANACLSGLSISDASLAGMTINGILVTDLLESHEAMQVLASISNPKIEESN